MLVSLQYCPWDVHLRELRANCYESLGMYQSAISDIKSVCLTLRPPADPLSLSE